MENPFWAILDNDELELPENFYWDISRKDWLYLIDGRYTVAMFKKNGYYEIGRTWTRRLQQHFGTMPTLLQSVEKILEDVKEVNNA